MIAIVDYGMGNLRSVQKALQKLGYEAEITSDPEAVRRADKVILPGVGAFGAAMENLRRAGLDRAIRECIESGKPFLGICLGLQLLFDYSEETWTAERERGLGILRGRVVRFPEGLRDSQGNLLKVPHIGWNALHIVRQDTLFNGVAEGSHVYFVHSYYPEPEDEQVVLARSDYGVHFCCAVQHANIRAVQFHPEKSSAVGLRILRNFAESGA
ncbi:MAG: imidazole glycerol phosphate synthase subunit HisH [Chthonomonadetes bacterium]|nr:imidazole glycerol phosphate synthase subunit HisH [Chthonomonadetes bacterium]